MLMKAKRIVFLLLTGLPGVALAMLAKPFHLGPRVLEIGLLLAFGLPAGTYFGTSLLGHKKTRTRAIERSGGGSDFGRGSS